MNLEDFAKELHESVLRDAGSREGGEYQENEFTRKVVEWLTDAGECIDPQVCYFKSKTPGMKLNGWDRDEDGDLLDLFVTVFSGTEPMPRISKGELHEAGERGIRFFAKSMNGLWKNMDESSPAYSAARDLAEHSNDIRRVRVFILTNSLTRAETIPDSQLDGKSVTYHIWDIEHLYQIFAGKTGPEPIEVNEHMLGGGIRCISNTDNNGVYAAYVGVVRGDVLATLYERWGQRLLERNLRSYLQTKGKINQGILKTLQNSSWMFLAYNNGISTTADAVNVLTEKEGQCLIRSISNFQIVNGGQTTASLVDAQRRHGIDLSRVWVQIKLTVLNDPSTVDLHVPLIARFANSQNKINVSDFSSNNPYLIALERLSRSTWVPNPEQRGKSTTKWYFERTRGQYLSELLSLPNQSEKNSFKLLFPSNKKLTKTSVAKFEMIWWQYPHTVSLGAEKNFSHFMQIIMDSNYGLPDERYFMHLVAKAIIFEKCDRIVREEEFIGYKANIVAYAMAYLSNRTAALLNLDEIWDRQDISPDIEAAMRRIVQLVQQHIMKPPREGMNIGEWCKKEQCWTSLLEKSFDMPDLSAHMLEPGEDGRTAQPLAKKHVPLTPAQEELVKRAAEYPADVWLSLAAWGKETGFLNTFERSLTYNVGRMMRQGRRLSPDQAKYAMPALENAILKGFDTAKQQPRQRRK